MWLSKFSCLSEYTRLHPIYIGITYYAQIINSKQFWIYFSEDHFFALANSAWADPEGGGGQGSGPPPPENHKNIEFPSNIDPDPLKITRLRSQHSMVSHYRHASEWRLAGGPMIAHF